MVAGNVLMKAVLICQLRGRGITGILSLGIALDVVTAVAPLHHKYHVVPGNLCSSL